MGNTEKNSEAINQNQNSNKNQLGMYSEVMRSMDERLLSKNLITKEQLTKSQPSQQDNTIEVTFLNRSNKGQQK